jgi:hypothetical protein
LDDLVTQQGPLQRMWEHEQATDQLLVAAA